MHRVPCIANVDKLAENDDLQDDHPARDVHCSTVDDSNEPLQHTQPELESDGLVRAPRKTYGLRSIRVGLQAVAVKKRRREDNATPGV